MKKSLGILSTAIPAGSATHRAAVIVAALALASGTDRALAQRPIGVDVSDIQGTGINWSSVKGAGISFSWAKATEGTGYIASSFVGNEINGKAAGVYMGAYDFTRPDLVSPGPEADYFWAEAGPYIKNDGKSLMPMADVETFNGVVGASSYAAWVNTWCDTVISHAAGAGVTVRPVIYTTTCEACNLNSSMSQWIPWIANPSGENDQTGSPWDYTSCDSCDWWGGWTVWQYSWNGSVSGIPGAVDLDVFNGNSSQLVNSLVIGGGNNKPAVVMNADGRLEAFAVWSDGTLQHTWETAANSTIWSGWSSLGGANNTDVGASIMPNGCLQVFVIGTGGAIYTQWQTSAGGGWNGTWLKIGGSNYRNLAVSTNLDGRIQVFALDQNTVVQSFYETTVNTPSAWAGPNNMGGGNNFKLTVSHNTDGRMEAFVLGTGTSVYHQYQTSPNGGWNGSWPSLGGANNTQISVAQSTDGTQEVFVLGTGSQVYHQWQTSPNGGWSGSWPSLGGGNNTQIATTVNMGGGLEVFVIGTGTQVYHVWQTSLHSGWQDNWPSLGGANNRELAVAPNVDRTIDCFVVGTGNSLYHKKQNTDGSWPSSWSNLGGILR